MVAYWTLRVSRSSPVAKFSLLLCSLFSLMSEKRIFEVITEAKHPFLVNLISCFQTDVSGVIFLTSLLAEYQPCHGCNKFRRPDYLHFEDGVSAISVSPPRCAHWWSFFFFSFFLLVRWHLIKTTSLSLTNMSVLVECGVQINIFIHIVCSKLKFVRPHGAALCGVV